MEIKHTGDIGNVFMYRTLTINKKELTENLSLLAEENKVNFICIQDQRKINFIHITSVDNLEFINNNGLTSSGHVGDLGPGIYLVEFNDIHAIENVKNYISLDTNEYILKITGTYTGKFIQCIYDKTNEHLGYVVTAEDIPLENISNVEVIAISDFLTNNSY